MYESQKWKKSDPKSAYCMIPVYEILEKVKSKQIGVARAREWGRGSWMQTGTRKFLEGWENSNCNYGGDHTTISIYQNPSNSTLKMDSL